MPANRLRWTVEKNMMLNATHETIRKVRLASRR
jgi:hypothetical protein